MRSAVMFIPILLILADGVACNDDPEVTGAAFGEPCEADAYNEGNHPCADGLSCFTGYCEEQCDDDTDCQDVEGFRHECVAGLCHIYCDDTSRECPQTLAASPLECAVMWCEGAS